MLLSYFHGEKQRWAPIVIFLCDYFGDDLLFNADMTNDRRTLSAVSIVDIGKPRSAKPERKIAPRLCGGTSWCGWWPVRFSMRYLRCTHVL